MCFYDTQDRLVSEKIGGIEKVRYIYDKRSNVAQVNDYYVNVTTKFSYDLIGRITGISSSDGQKLNYNYDALNRLKKTKWSLADIYLTYEYGYGEMESIGEKTNMLYRVKLNGVQDLKYTYDGLCRLKTKTLATHVPYTINYGYREGAESGSTTNLIGRIDNGGRVLEYYYDNNGNINVVTENGAILWLYYYDDKNQLTRAQDYFDTYDYTYDNNGNILSASKNGETIKTYTYGNANWKDLLTQYNGQTITYDTIGNPLQYRDGMNFTWANGRQLSTVTNGANSYSYTYNADGLRTAKTVNGVTTNYYWSNGILQAQKTGDEYLIFLYDENGSAYGFLVKNGTTQQKYYYLFNAQGDVIGIVDSNGTQVVNYYYGAWGDVMRVTGTKASTIGEKNPLRYRGYYYDAETGFYYLQTRYYDPETGRFLNADGFISTGQGILSNNMFAYCGNNPVNNADYSGNRYCAATTVKNESSYDRAVSCSWQNQVALENLNPISIKHELSVEQFKNSDGSYSFYSNNRDGSKVFTETILKVNAATGLDIEDGLGISFEADFYTGGWHYGNTTLNLLDLFHAEASAYIETNENDLRIGAFASIYSPSFSFTVNGNVYEIGLEIGSIGAVYSKKNGKSKVKGGYLFGFTISW